MKIEKEIWWILDSGENDGAYNMATDEFLAKNVKNKPVLRFFKWKPFCLSLGYAQKNGIFNYEKLKKNGIDVVRRPTGGRAVLHTDEVTYSVIIPKSHCLFNLNTTELYKSISYALLNGLRYLGISATIEKNKKVTDEHNKFSPYCFSSITRYELKFNGKKIIGSAQRRYKTSVLQQGSIPLNNYNFNLDEFILFDNLNKDKKRNIASNFNYSISKLINKNVSYEEVVESIKRGFEDIFQIFFRKKEITSSQKTLIKQLSKRYLIYN